MKRIHAGPVVVVLGLGLLATGARSGLRAQAPAPANPSGDAVAALVAEVRALRAELSQIASAGVRSQLLVTRIQLQEQRLLHLDRQRADLATRLDSAVNIRTMFTMQLANMTRDSGNLTAEQRRGLDDGIAGLKPQLTAAENSERALRSELDALLAALATEQGRWADFNGRLDELEKALPARR